MAFGSVELVPGVNVERTPTALKAGISTSQNIRFKDGLTQKIGGFQKYYSFNIAGTPRELHAWQDLNGAQHLLAGTTSSLGVITSGSFVSITPQQVKTDVALNFTTTTGSLTIGITDTGVNNLTIYDTLMLNTPVSVGGIILSGLYTIQNIVGSTAYTISAATAALTAVNGTGSVPLFSTTINSFLVAARFTAHGMSNNNIISFQATTTVGGITVIGSYPVTVVDANNFTFTAGSVASSTATSYMNSGNAEFLYYISLGPSPSGSGYGSGGYGSGGYGSGIVPSSMTGTPITATDWTSDNWGQIALACPNGGAIYAYDPTAGFTAAAVVPSAPPFNNGIFVSSTLQILFCWGSTATNAIGQALDPMLIKWSDVGDYTQFKVLTTDQAGSFRLPSGSMIRGGMAAQNQNLFWTDIDFWAAQYLGYPLEFSFNKIGSGAGLISSHAAQQLRGGVYWMGQSNFYSYIGGVCKVMPCPMWDFVFQNLNTSFTQNIRSMPNTPYNEAGWLFPSAASVSGECDSYIKFNLTEPGMPWDGGLINRSAWIDQNIIGNPISATSNGIIYLQETTNDADGQPLTSTFTSGYFYIAEGEEFAFVDQIYPDMIWGTYGSQSTGTAQVYISFNVTNYPGDVPTVYGPYLMTSTTEYISVRFRGRQMSVTVKSSDLGSFWRLGRIRYRYAPSGRR